MTLSARRVMARFLQGGPRSFFARREMRPDLYADLQKAFKQFQSSLFALSHAADQIPDRHEKDAVLDLLDDLPAKLDEAIGLPHEKVMEAEYKAKLAALTVGLEGLTDLFTKALPSLPPKVQRSAGALLKAKMKAAQVALNYISRFMDKYVKEMKVEEAKAEKARQKAEKEDQKARQNAEWCADNCEPCKDTDYFHDSLEPF